jgi:hypothetical protein
VGRWGVGGMLGDVRVGDITDLHRGYKLLPTCLLLCLHVLWLQPDLRLGAPPGAASSQLARGWLLCANLARCRQCSSGQCSRA